MRTYIKGLAVLALVVGIVGVANARFELQQRLDGGTNWTASRGDASTPVNMVVLSASIASVASEATVAIVSPVTNALIRAIYAAYGGKGIVSGASNISFYTFNANGSTRGEVTG